MYVVVAQSLSKEIIGVFGPFADESEAYNFKHKRQYSLDTVMMPSMWWSVWLVTDKDW